MLRDGILVAPGFCLAVGVRRHVFLWVQKLLVNFFSKCYQNSKWPPEVNSKFFVWVRKLRKLSSEIIQISESHSPQYGDVQVIFSRFYGNSKWPPRINLNFRGVEKTQKLKVVIYSNFTITFTTIWRCASDFFKVLRKFKMAAMHELHNISWAQKLISEIMCR